MSTLFDLAKYHREPQPDPNKPIAAECLRLIAEAEAAGDTAWLQNFQHFLFLNCELYAKADYQAIFDRHAQAAEGLRSQLKAAS